MPSDVFKRLIILFSLYVFSSTAFGQMYAEKFGKNRLQFEKKRWHYLKTNFFDIYYTDSTDRMAEFVAIVAERELPAIEKQLGYSLPRRLEILLYSSFNDYLASNLGKSFLWQESEGIAPVIEGKLALYYDGKQKNLESKVRQGIINFLYRTYIYGDLKGDPETDIQDQRMPTWLSIGYMAYKAETWSPELDDALRNNLLNSNYRSFDDFLFKHPLLAAHAFWYYVELLKGKEGTTALMNFLEVSQSVKRSFNVLFEKKEKEVKQDFMNYMRELYDEEGSERESTPNGDQLLYEIEDLQTKYYNFVVHPEEDNRSYAYVRYKKGVTDVVFVDENGDTYVILSLGYLFKQPLYFKYMPSLAWNNKGDQLAIAYPFEQKTKILLYNTDGRYKGKSFFLDHVDFVQSIKYDFQDNKLIMSAFRNGQSDIYAYHLDRGRLYQITNDPYDDLDPSPIIFSNKTGIIYSSNRPLSGTTKDDQDKVYTPSSTYNICTVDDWLTEDFRTINKITNLTSGNAFFPVQYNSHYYSFIADINGIYNRYLGRVFNINKKSKTISVIQGKNYIDQDPQQLSERLSASGATKIDTTYGIGNTLDSSTIFPISDYASSIYESRTSGRNGRITQVYYDGDYKTAYLLDAEEGVSNNRLPTLSLSRYFQSQQKPTYSHLSIPTTYVPFADTSSVGEFFLVPNYASPLTSTINNEVIPNFSKENLYTYQVELKGTEAFKYRRQRFQTTTSVSLESGFFTEKLQAYAGGSGPVFSSNGSSVGSNIRLSVQDVSGNYESYIGFRLGFDNITFASWLDQIEFSLGFNNYRRRMDWGVGYRFSKRRMEDVYSEYAQSHQLFSIPIKQFNHFFTFKLAYPLDAIRSVRFQSELRNEQYVYLANPQYQAQDADYPKDTKSRTAIVSRLEYVFDNTFSRFLNISEGLKYKIYLDWIVPVQDNTDFAPSGNVDPNIINIGSDVRYYRPIYKEMTFASRLGIDMSFGDRRILYYVGGADGWILPTFNPLISPSRTYQYAYQSLAVNLRGFKQNATNGSSAMTLNFELRVPSTTFTDRYISSLFLRNLQLITFTDLGTAWNDFADISRPFYTYKSSNTPVSVSSVAGGIGPFIGGYGAGIRTKLLGQYIKFDMAWNFDTFFKESPMFYLSFGFDF